VSYDEAKRWLEKVGGEMTEVRGTGWIMVSLKAARDGRIVRRQAKFDDALEGKERETAIRRAFVLACEDLRIALD
jgi:hypothetical protein